MKILVFQMMMNNKSKIKYLNKTIYKKKIKRKNNNKNIQVKKTTVNHYLKMIQTTNLMIKQINFKINKINKKKILKRNLIKILIMTLIMNKMIVNLIKMIKIQKLEISNNIARIKII